MEKIELKSLLEALLFTATEPLNLDHFISVIPETNKGELRDLLPSDAETWTPWAGVSGLSGYFRDVSEVEKFINGLSRSEHQTPLSNPPLKLPAA